MTQAPRSFEIDPDEAERAFELFLRLLTPAEGEAPVPNHRQTICLDSTDSGFIDFTVEFDLTRVVGTLWTFFIEMLKPSIDGIEDAVAKSGRTVDEVILELSRSRGPEVGMCLRHAVRMTATEIGPKLKQATQELLGEVAVRTLHELRGQITQSSTLRLRKNVAEDIKALFPVFLRQSKERMKMRGRGGSQPQYDLTELGNHYNDVYPRWREARSMYRGAMKAKEPQRRSRWSQAISETYPEFPTDLICRLDRASQLTDEALTSLERKGGSPAPADIALEHAARLCGVPAYHYTLRHLKGRRSQQRCTPKTEVKPKPTY